jgi:hypothetical protein
MTSQRHTFLRDMGRTGLCDRDLTSYWMCMKLARHHRLWRQLFLARCENSSDAERR